MKKISMKDARALGLSRRSFVQGAAAGAGALALAGCSSSSDSSGSSDDADSEEEEVEVEADLDATVTFAITTAWESFNPYICSTSYSYLVADKIFDRPCYVNDDYVSEPRAASSWEIEDETKLVFHLDEGATWHDGEPVTADDWVFTLQTISSSEVTAVSRSFCRYLEGCSVAGIEESEGSVAVEARDDYTVVCTMNKAYSLDSFMLCWAPSLYILPEHVFEGMTPAEVFASDHWESPIGSGPFAFDSMVSGSSITLTSFEDYQLGQPQFAQLVFQVLAASNFANSIMAGEVDLTYTHIDVDDALALEGQDGISIVRNDLPTFYQVLSYNHNTMSQNMRKAVNYGIDKATLVEEYYNGDAELVETIVMPTTDYYKGNSVTRDVETAASYLQAAIDAGEWEEGQVFELGVNTDSREKQGALIAQNLEEIGLTCNVTMYDSSTMWSYLSDGTIQGCLMGLMPTTDILSSRAYFESMYKDVLYFHIGYDVFDELIEGLETATDEDTKKDLIEQFQDAEADLVPFSWICAQYSYAATSTRLGNADPFASDVLNNATWKWTVA